MPDFEIKTSYMLKINLFRVCVTKRNQISRFLLVVLLVGFCVFFPTVYADAGGSLTSVKDTLTNSRPSVSTTLGGAVTAGDTTITLASTRGILQGDSITLAGGTSEAVTVATVISATQVAITTAAANAHSNSTAVYDKQTSTHTVTFTTRSTVATGSFDVIFSGATTNTGNPTSQFDFNSTTTTDVSVAGFTAGTKTLTAASGKWNVAFTTSIASSTAITITIGSTNKMLNPTKSAADGTADTWTVQINENDSSNTIDTTSVKVATIESVSVTATIAPTLTFTIAGVASGASSAGQTTTAASTATTVPFGTLTAATPAYVSQTLTVSTNSDSGYAVTTYQDGALRKTNGTTISSFSTTAAEQNGNNGFGFTLSNASGTTASFLYNDSGATLKSSGFGTSGTPVSVMSNTAAANTDSLRVTYIVRVSSTQATGDYRNVVTYIATATY